MRDIRSDLRERIAAIGERYAQEESEYERQRDELEMSHAKTMAELGRERAALEQLLVIENEREGVPALTIAQKLQNLVPLADFLVAKVETGTAMDKEELRATARLAGYQIDGRTFHATLMNITKGGRLARLPDGRYAFPNREPILFDTGDNNARPMN